jgi:hypothetical protein
MSRRLLESRGRRGLNAYDDEFGRYLLWEPLPTPKPLDLPPNVQPQPLHAMGSFALYEKPGTGARARARARAVDRLLGELGIRPRGSR